MSLQTWHTLELLAASVSTAFYDTDVQLVLSAIVRSREIKDETLVQHLCLTKNEVRKVTQRLKEERLIDKVYRVEARPPGPDGTVRQANRVYWFVNWRVFINVVRWRLWKLESTFNERMQKEVSARGFQCRLCEKLVMQQDIIAFIDKASGLAMCDQCGIELKHNDNHEKIEASERIKDRFAAQVKPIVSLLRETDNLLLPPVPTSDKKGSKAGGGSLGGVEILVNMGDEDEDEAAAKARAAASRIEHVQPAWVKYSTITANGESMAENGGGGGFGGIGGFGGGSTKKQNTDATSTDSANDAVEANGGEGQPNNVGINEQDVKKYIDQYRSRNSTGMGFSDMSDRWSGFKRRYQELEENHPLHPKNDLSGNASISIFSTGNNATGDADSDEVVMITNAPPPDTPVLTGGDFVRYDNLTEDHIRQMDTNEYQEFYNLIAKFTSNVLHSL
ncbi:hypothetical protein GQ42DRAFT_72107 [Ramicandelaber brevisporus]|nr:hypothetical protein GQ42DRAFT_72107 [Ramicandelaber brevisporus]